MNDERALMRSVETLGTDAEELARWSCEVPQLPTPDLVSGYVKLDGFLKKVKSFHDLVKKELMTNDTQTTALGGRFIDDKDVRIDEKGHRYLTGVDGVELKAEKRVSAALSVEAATEYLKENGLYEEALEHFVCLTNVEEVMQTQDELLALLEELQPYLAREQLELLYEAKRLVKTLTTTSAVLSESKIEALVTLDKIPTEDLELLVPPSVNYALIAPKGKKK